MAQSEITLVKNGITVTIYVVEIDDAFANKIFIIAPPQTKNNQALGPKNPKLVDLLRITRTIVMTGEIKPTATKTANQVKKDLINIGTGAGANGGLVTLNYDGLGRSLTSNSDATSIEGFLEKFAFNEKSSDEPASPPTNFAKFTVQLTFLEGIEVS